MELHGTVLSKRVSLEKQHSMSTDSKLASVYVNKREELFILCALEMERLLALLAAALEAEAE